MGRGGGQLGERASKSKKEIALFWLPLYELYIFECDNKSQ
jgi:hypothetical protein